MDLPGAAAIDIYSMALLAVIHYHSLRHNERRSMQHKLYMIVLQATFVMLVFDLMGRFDGRPDTIYPMINHVGNFLLFFLSPVLPSLWLAYVHLQVTRDEAKTKRLLVPLLAVNTVNATVAVLTPSQGWYYYIDAGNVYHRGPLFLLGAFITIALILAAVAVTVANRKRIERKHYLSLLFFPVPPFACIILQIVVYGMSLILNGVALSLLIVFLNIQTDNIYTDYLTGINNRKKLESYIEKRIGMSTERRTFSAILMDLDNFKSINDTFGHDVGDRALQISADLLKSCLRSGDFIARFGGDEFCIVLDTSERAGLEAAAHRIHGCIQKYNESGSQPYKLEFSMGYAVYDYHSHMRAEDFQRQIDMLMYEDKKRSGRHVEESQS